MEVNEPILNYWYRALSSPLGIEVVTSDPAGLRPRLYAARKEAKDLDLHQISVCSSPFDPTKIWLLKRANRNEEA